jgi:site-specific DNA-methyltransferase (adenine-specific)
MISEVHNEKCEVGLPRYPDKFWDLAVCDPPYGINAPSMTMGTNLTRKDGSRHKPSTADRLTSGGGKLKNRLLNKSVCDWDREKPTEEYFTELRRVSKNQIIFGGNYFDLGPTRCIICWDKVQPWENFSQWEMAWTSFDSPASMFRYSNTGGNNRETKIHPTQKPVALYAWILQKYAKPGDKILDTHMGSQSSRVAAYKLGFDYWGWEIDPVFFKDGNNRFKNDIAMPLFDSVTTLI